MQIGFSTSFDSTYEGLIKRIEQQKAVSDSAIELSFTRTEMIPKRVTNEFVKLIEGFEFITMHAPVKHRGEWVRYPSLEVEPHMTLMQDIIEKVKVEYVLFHPDLIDDFEYVNSTFEDVVVFENMDIEKSFGKNIQDLEAVFKESPKAGWVCDVNHIFTNDKSMLSSKGYHERFGERLRYYHISGFGGFHAPFSHNLEELVILDGVLDLSKPLIHEGMSFDMNIQDLEKEMELIEANLKG